MPTITFYQNLDGVDCVNVVYEDGTTWSGYKATYDAQQAQVSTPLTSQENN